MLNDNNRFSITSGCFSWRVIRLHPSAVIGLGLFLVIVLLCLLGPLMETQSYADGDLRLGATPPSREHWFGTDTLGRDLWVRTLYGGRISIAVGFAASLVALGVGLIYGMVAGYSGGRIDSWMMRFVDVLYALPFIIIVILLTVILGRSLLLLFIAIGLVEWLTMARIVRGEVRRLKQQPFIEAAVAYGAKMPRIFVRHLLPNLLAPVIVYTTLTIPAVMLLESVLSFLGLGVQPPMSSWGSLIKEGAERLDVYPWMLFFPALFFATTLLALNFLGDALRDILDPRNNKV
jgi:oligopeptide transport system permease protein